MYARNDPNIQSSSDFSALEGLLNIFGVIQPACKKSKEEYNAFVRDVFSDQIETFSNCRERIMELLASASRGDWEEAATKVIDILSASNISLCVTHYKLV